MAADNGNWQGAVRSYRRLAAAKPGRRRFNRAVGSWLGGVILGAGGCLLGACLPYKSGVGVTVGVLWWGIYCGCFGTSIGALLGLWAEQTPAPPGAPGR
jgi:hypothetical protein